MHVVFGRGTIASAAEIVSKIGARRGLLLSTPEQARELDVLAKVLEGVAVARFTEATVHTPLEITDRAMCVIESEKIDVTVSLGGGSTIGLGKAIALRSGIPQVAIPTTYAGSEMTPIIGQTVAGQKTTQRSERVLPRAVIYDVDLTLNLPPTLSVASGMNAIAHAAEGLYARDSNPLMQLIAEDAIRALATALPGIVRQPTDVSLRSEALYGAWLCGIVLGNVGMALHHKLCHTIGGRFNLPHAETHSIILPHALAYNRPAISDALGRLNTALGTTDAPGALFDLAKRLGAPQGLKALGMPESGIDRAVDEVLRNPYWNPRPLEHAALLALVQRAWSGKRPEAG
jgi:maleylacetate reductase